MEQLLYSAKLTWNNVGKISGEVLTAQRGREHNLNFGLMPSLPLLTCHQLGSFSPAHGLTLCSELLRRFEGQAHSLTPINTVMAGAEIKIFQKGSGGFLTYNPIHKKNYDDESLEEASRQFLHNYTEFVFSEVPEDKHLPIWAFILSGLSAYYEILEEAVKKKIISKNDPQWNIEISLGMHTMSSEIGKSWVHEIPADQREVVKKNLNQIYIELFGKEDELARVFGLR